MPLHLNEPPVPLVPPAKQTMPAVDGFAGSVGSVGSAGYAGYAGYAGPAGSTVVHRHWRLAPLDSLAPPDNRIGGRGGGDNANEERKRLVQSVRLFVVDAVLFYFFFISVP